MTSVPCWWIRFRTGKWHAWFTGGHYSVCAHLRQDDLRGGGLTRLEKDPPSGSRDRVCQICARRVGHTQPRPPGVSPREHAWLSRLQLHYLRERLKPAVPLLLRLARLLAGQGTPTTEEGRHAFVLVTTILCRPFRSNNRVVLPRLKEVLTLLEEDPEAFPRVLRGLQEWRETATGDLEAFRVDTVVRTLLDLPVFRPSLRPYLAQCRALGITTLAQTFHPNTLTRIRKGQHLRGWFKPPPTYLDGGTTDTTSDLVIITE